MTIADIFVGACFILGAFGAFFTAFHPNILYAAISLILSLLSVAGLYGALGADFLAAAQLIIYIGGILIVILFAVMMSEDIYKKRFFEGAKKYIWPTIFSGIVFVTLTRVMMQVDWSNGSTPDFEPTSRAMGWALVGPYAVTFQYVAIILLFGLIGAVIIARPAIKMKQRAAEIAVEDNTEEKDA